MSSKDAWELAEEYKDDLKPLKANLRRFKKLRDKYSQLKRKHENRGEWALALSYSELYLKYKTKAEKLGPIISSSEYSIHWLQTGSEPQSGRSVSRLSYEQRTRIVPEVEDVLTFINFTLKGDLTDDELAKIDDYLSCLTERERDAYISIRGKGNSYEETATFPGVSKSTVQSYVKRATQKIEQALDSGVQTALF